MDTLAFLTQANCRASRPRSIGYGACSSARRPRRRAPSLARMQRPLRSRPTGVSRPRPADPNTDAPRCGHGRTSAAAYSGAHTVRIAHPTLHRGDPCPGCTMGKIYALAQPATLVRITGMAPLVASVYERERWRCNLCGEVFTAPAPEGVGEAKYDASATSMVGLLKYGCGLPFHRIEVLQRGMRIPLPAATQWELVREALPQLVPAWARADAPGGPGRGPLQRRHDDEGPGAEAETAAANAADEAEDQTDAHRRVYHGDRLHRQGQQHRPVHYRPYHAGENLDQLLARRAPSCAAHPDVRRALAQSFQGVQNIVANCLAHGRRPFVDLAQDFPAECQHVLESLGEVYKHDAAGQRVEVLPKPGSGSTRSTVRRSWTTSSTGWASSWNRNAWNLTPGWARPSTTCSTTGRPDPVPAPGRRAPG